MGSTVTIKDIMTLEEFIFINTLYQCQSVWVERRGGGSGRLKWGRWILLLAFSKNLKSFFRLNEGFYLAYQKQEKQKVLAKSVATDDRHHS